MRSPPAAPTHHPHSSTPTPHPQLLTPNPSTPTHHPPRTTRTPHPQLVNPHSLPPTPHHLHSSPPLITNYSSSCSPRPTVYPTSDVLPTEDTIGEWLSNQLVDAETAGSAADTAPPPAPRSPPAAQPKRTGASGAADRRNQEEQREQSDVAAGGCTVRSPVSDDDFEASCSRFFSYLSHPMFPIHHSHVCFWHVRRSTPRTPLFFLCLHTPLPPLPPPRPLITAMCDSPRLTRRQSSLTRSVTSLFSSTGRARSFARTVAAVQPTTILTPSSVRDPMKRAELFGWMWIRIRPPVRATDGPYPASLCALLMDPIPLPINRPHARPCR